GHDSNRPSATGRLRRSPRVFCQAESPPSARSVHGHSRISPKITRSRGPRRVVVRWSVTPACHDGETCNSPIYLPSMERSRS
ncbi:hypothetical protein PENTCL1PPCAC_24961, partial [Pristionchus entomophagus]